MYARVASFEGGNADEIRANMEEIKSMAATGSPEGVKSTGFTLLADPEGGRVLAVGLFATEADIDASEAALDAMSPPAGSMGRRTSVERWEVGVDVRM